MKGKSSILVLFLFAMTLVGCGGNNKVLITGTVEDESLNGKYLYVQERINREWIKLDSVKIDNGAFSYKGLCDSSRIVYLTYNVEGQARPVSREFVFEPGHIDVHVDKDDTFVVKGTKENEILQSYFDAENVVYKKMQEFQKSLQADVTSADSTKQRLYNEMEEKLTSEIKEIALKFSKEKANTIAGSHVFMNSFYYFSVQEKDDIIALFNEATKKIQRVSEIIADNEVEKNVAVGKPFVDFKQSSVDGTTIALSDLVGKSDYLLIDFWASWCGPCIRSFPELTAFYNKNKGRKFDIIGVSLDDNEQAWKGAIEKYKLDWNHVSDLQGWKNQASRKYAINSIPSTVLINKQGVIVAKNATLSEIESFIKSAN